MSYSVGYYSSSSSTSSDDDDLEMQRRNLVLQTTTLVSEQKQIMQQYYMSMQTQNTWGGSVPRHATLNRGRGTAASLLKNDYFVEHPTFESKFRRRFRMSRTLFHRIRRGLKDQSPVWKKRTNCAGDVGFTSYQKMCASIQFLAYGTAADSFDQYFRIAESTLLDYVKPNATDITKLLQVAEAGGFPGMLGSLDYMHWKWENCQISEAGAYHGRNKTCTIILEAVASYDTWIWHAFFGLPGTNNDINVLNRSHLFRDLENGTSLPANYSIKGRNYNVGYYLTDDIYPKWSTLLQTIPHPKDDKHKYFAKAQEGYRKDVERAFGILQKRFAIVRGGARLWNKSTLSDIMNACIIMHNMIVEEERSTYIQSYVFVGNPPPSPEVIYDGSSNIPTARTRRDHTSENSYVRWLAAHRAIMNVVEHHELQTRLINHVWDTRGQRSE